jgi:hypothetical protein
VADDTQDYLQEIGQLLAEERAYPLENTLLYAEVGRTYVGESIYKMLGNQILYHPLDNDRLGYALLALWEAQETEDRWAEIEYLIRDGKFAVTYVYPDDIDPEDEFNARRERAVRRHLGDKPIVYPPWEDDDGIPGYAM